MAKIMNLLTILAAGFKDVSENLIPETCGG